MSQKFSNYSSTDIYTAVASTSSLVWPVARVVGGFTKGFKTLSSAFANANLACLGSAASGFSSLSAAEIILSTLTNFKHQS